jgi:MFS family permease
VDISVRPEPKQVALKRVALASYAGSAIEFYDFFIYGTAAALVFPVVFFPHLSHVMATVASLGTFASAFLARPVGAAVFGHFGDRIGRVRVLVFTLVIMGVSTVGVGLIPSTESIGVAAPLLLISLRLMQGFAVGGEWGGAALLSAEYAPPGRRGRHSMAPQLGLGSALVLANLVFLVVHRSFGDASSAFLSWGWRIPFLFSGVLIAVAVVVRWRVHETPAFSNRDPETPLPETPRPETPRPETPLAALMRNQGRHVVLAVGSVVGVLMLAYQIGTYFTHYATSHLKYSMNFVLLVGVMGGLCAVGMVATSATLSDKFGRRRVIGFGYALAVPWSLAVFPLVETHSKPVFTLVTVTTYAIIGICMGPLAAFLPEIFAVRYRYTGAGLSYNLGGIIGGALPPVISEPLEAAYGSWTVGVMMAVFAGVSLASVLLIGDPKHSDGTLTT